MRQATSITSAHQGHERPTRAPTPPLRLVASSRMLYGALSLWLLLFTIELVASFLLCGHQLILTLDDPYIHLAVADQILAGGYGVNAGDFSSPSSSVIWPYLIAGTEMLHLGAYGPLLISAAAAAVTIVAVVRLLGSLGPHGLELESYLPAVMAALIIAATSALALPMTGLEHSLHVWASVVTLVGLIEAARGRPTTWVHLIALVMLPLIRFEGAAFALAALAGFAMLGHWRFAAVASTLIAALLALYVVSMTARGLPLLPSSVLLKSRIAEQAYGQHSALWAIIDNFKASLANPYGQRLILLGLAICGGAWWLRADYRALIVCGAVLAAIFAHLGFGQYDWFHRYEVYVIALAAVTLLWIIMQLLPRLTAGGRSAALMAAVAAIGFASLPYVSAAAVTPFATRGIHEQQHQMGRFAREFFPHPVAVNDLGLVAWRNPNFVLDLWGLGSEAVRKAKLTGDYGPAQMAELAEARGVQLAMIYDRWFPAGVPATWTKVAVLHTTPITAGDADVTFYRTPSADQVELARALDAFVAQLPPGVTLERVLR